jgi:hypothetical protein
VQLLLQIVFVTLLNDYMTVEQFGNATYYVQKTIIAYHGNFLLQKTVDTHTCKLFALDDFYVEVNYCLLPYTTPLIQSFSIAEIDDYLSDIDLSDIRHLLS